MFDQPYAYGTAQQPWHPPLDDHSNEGAASLASQSLAQWERPQPVDYPPVSAATYDQASWYYPTPTSSDCSPLYAAPPRPISWEPAYANNNLRLSQHEPYPGSLQHGYQVNLNQRPYSPATSLEPSPAVASEAPRDAFLRPSTNPPSRQVSPAPPPPAPYDHSNGSTMYPVVTAAAHPPFNLDYSTAASSGAPPPASPWAPHQLYGDAPLASSSTAEWPTQPIHAPIPLPLPTTTARSFSTTSSVQLDQDRGTWLREARLDDSFGWNQQDGAWQNQVHGHQGAGRLEARPAAGYWDWTAPNPTPLPPRETSGALSHMSRSGSRTGSLVGTPREGVAEQDGRDLGVGSSSLSSSAGAAGLWDESAAVASPSWTPGQHLQGPQPPRSNHSTPLPLEHLSLSHLSRHASVGSTSSSFPDVSKATTPPSLATLPIVNNNKGKGKAASTVSDGYSPPSNTAASVTGDPPKQRKQRRKANEPPRDMAQRRYACELCVEEPRLFARPSALKIHLLTHTKEKPHTCPTCNRAFAIASNLKRHQKLHAANARKAAAEDETAHLMPIRAGGPLQEYQTT